MKPECRGRGSASRAGFSSSFLFPGLVTSWVNGSLVTKQARHWLATWRNLAFTLEGVSPLEPAGSWMELPDFYSQKKLGPAMAPGVSRNNKSQWAPRLFHPGPACHFLYCALTILEPRESWPKPKNYLGTSRPWTRALKGVISEKRG